MGIGRSGMKNREEILPLLHRLQRPIFFTLAHGFYQPTLELMMGACMSEMRTALEAKRKT